MSEQRRRFKLATVPEALLGVIVDVTLDIQRKAKPAEVPAALRPLLQFDRRGRTNSTVRRQVAVALDADERLADAAAEALAAMGKIVAAAKNHDPAAPLVPVVAAAASDSLSMHVAALWALAPDGADVALGVAVALSYLESVNAEIEAEREAAVAQVDKALESVRRAEATLVVEREKSARLQSELHDNRAKRRGQKDDGVLSEVAQRQRAEVAEAGLDAAVKRAEAVELRLQEATERSAVDRADLKNAKTELRAATKKLISVVAVSDVLRLSERAEELGRELARLAASGSVASDSVEVPNARAKNARRPRATVPGGLTSETAAGLAAMLRTQGVLLIVDGYNVAFAGWPEASAADKRDHVTRGLTELQARYGCEVLCVFDGDGSEAKPKKRESIRVIFSAGDEEADTVVVRAVEDLDLKRSAVVVSSDRWVKENAEARGATAVPSEVLIAVLKMR